MGDVAPLDLLSVQNLPYRLIVSALVVLVLIVMKVAVGSAHCMSIRSALLYTLALTVFSILFYPVINLILGNAQSLQFLPLYFSAQLLLVALISAAIAYVLPSAGKRILREMDKRNPFQ
jgi:hypothetical protein